MPVIALVEVPAEIETIFVDAISMVPPLSVVMVESALANNEPPDIVVIVAAPVEVTVPAESVVIFAAFLAFKVPDDMLVTVAAPVEVTVAPERVPIFVVPVTFTVPPEAAPLTVRLFPKELEPAPVKLEAVTA